MFRGLTSKEKDKEGGEMGPAISVWCDNCTARTPRPIRPNFTAPGLPSQLIAAANLSSALNGFLGADWLCPCTSYNYLSARCRVITQAEYSCTLTGWWQQNRTVSWPFPHAVYPPLSLSHRERGMLAFTILHLRQFPTCTSLRHSSDIFPDISPSFYLGMCKYSAPIGNHSTFLLPLWQWSSLLGLHYWGMKLRSDSTKEKHADVLKTECSRAKSLVHSQL